MPFTIEVQGVQELIDRYQAGDLVAFQEYAKAMNDSLDIVENNAQAYPPESEANAPPPPYYRRGIGTQYASGNRGESERLSSRWQKRISATALELVGILENTVTYAPFVHGIQRQAGFHAGRGWRTVAQIGREVTDRVQRRFDEAARNLARFLNG